MAIYSTKHGYLDRRTFLKISGLAGASAAAAGLLSACGGSGATSSASASGSGSASAEASASGAAGDLPATDTVVIGVYSGQWEDAIRQSSLDEYSADTDIDVQVVSGADAEWLTKIQAANGNNSPYDLLILQADSILRLADAGLLEEIPADKVPNSEELFASINERFTKGGKLYAAGFSIGQLGIGYRSDLVSKVPTSWADLADSAYAGQLAVFPPTYSAGLQFLWALTDDGADLDGAFDKLEELRANVVATPDDAGTLQTLLTNGDVAIAPNWDGRIFALQDGGADNLEFVYPSDGPIAVVASWAIPAGAPNLANAYDLLNYLSSAEVHTRHAPLAMYAMSNENTEYTAAFKAKAHVGGEYTDELVWVDYDVTNEHLSEFTEKFQEIFN